MVQEFRYVAPTSLEELLDYLAEQAREGKRAVVLNGGTDLLVSIRTGLETPDSVIDMKKVDELNALTFDPGEGLSIGATVTVNQLIDSEDVRRHYEVLHVAAEQLADFQLRNRATVVGNLVTASPCGDTGTPLLTLGAAMVLRSKSGRRTIPLGEFITGVKRTVIKPDEIVERVVVPAENADGLGRYKKLKRIKGHDLGLVMVAMFVKDGVMRFGIGSAAPTPVVLKDMKVGTDLETVRKVAQEAISPIDDVRASADYRRAIVDSYLKQLLQEVA